MIKMLYCICMNTLLRKVVCEEINGLYAMQQDTNINQKLDKRYDTCWYEHCLMEYPNRICWEKLQEYIIKKSKCK